MAYELWYWPGIPGRGEFVRLALEAACIPYRDCARKEDGEKALAEDKARMRRTPPYAPPYLVAEGMTIAQTATILLYLGEAHGLAPSDEAGKFWANQLQLTIMDAVAEAHTVHHPIAVMLTYEDQQTEAARAAKYFREHRIPGFLDYFEQILARRGPWLTRDDWAYPDLSLFQLIEGLRFAFPKRMDSLNGKYPRIRDLHEKVSALPVLKDYFASDRRLPFSNGIFRHYPQLDAE